MVSKFIQHGDSVFYAVAARVPGPRVGYLVQWRRVGTNTRSRDQTYKIIGTEAELYFGNVDGSVWTDLSNVAVAPPMELSQLKGIQTYRHLHGALGDDAASTLQTAPESMALEQLRHEVGAR